MSVITANDLKTHGVSSLERSLSDSQEAVITVRGEQRFVVMKLEHYHHLREMELEAALVQSREEVRTGNYVEETADEHFKRIAEK